MARYDVTGQQATFAAIATRFAQEGIAIDHFHCISEPENAGGYVAHCNFDGEHWYIEGFRDPSECDDDVSVAEWDRVVADEWHEVR